jgi:type IV pilus assembly protein PilY1
MLAMLLGSVLVGPAHAEIAQSPLYLTNTAEPNVMFVLDDSGSMHWEVMPDHSLVYFMFPRPNTLYGASYSSGYGSLTDTDGSYNGVARFTKDNRYARYFRTAQFNPLYYNPAVRYEPWKNADGTRMANASPTAARLNPVNSGEGTRNLTADDTRDAVWINNDGSESESSVTYYPATYFTYTGSNVLTGPTDANNIEADFTRVEIKPAIASFSKAADRTDCAATTCTYDEEIQNFANWYTYYRSRVLAARAGIGSAFAAQGNNMRVGFGTLNKASTTVDGVSTPVVVNGVRPFSGASRTDFFNALYDWDMEPGGTPLRKALDDVGQYYSRTDNRGPWGNTPGTDDGVATTTHAQCRQSYTILMTDGYWSEGSSYQASTDDARENVDGTDGPTKTSPASLAFPSGRTDTYSAESPFSDSYSNTLADVAMYYWKRDLRSDLENEVPTSTVNSAFWQHVSTFGVGLGVSGTVSPTAAFDAIGTGASITWPDPTASNAAKLDDLLHASVNGRGGFFSAADPATFATELTTVLNTIQDRGSSSSAAVASNSTRLTSNTHLYQALFNPRDWSGQLKAFPLQADGTIGDMAWDAADNVPAHGSRNIRTWSGSAGMEFSGTVGTLTAAQVNYLRGDDSLEIKNSTGPSDTLHVFRNRSTKLGDIVNSDPHFVHNENFGYNTLPSTAGTDYPAFLAGKSARTAMVYVGANDGMLHGFDASFVCQDNDTAVDSDGDTDPANDCDIKVPASTAGDELLAYVPKVVWPNLPLLTSPTYSHKYFVDGSPTSWDAYWGATPTWKTVLVGGLGAGGKGVYALDVTNPNSFGDGSVLWEFQGNTSTEIANMGHVMGNVTVARMKDGNFWAVFGNGFGSTSGKSVLFMVRIDAPSTVKMFELGTGTGNGLAQPTLVDVNGDRIIDLIYAGDLKGNVWKVEVTGSVATWGTAFGSDATPRPLFMAKDGSGVAQPITSGIEVGRAPTPVSGLMVYFGTGKYFEVGDNAPPYTVQTMYGVVDDDTDDELLRADLQQQSIIYEGILSDNRVRAMSKNTVDYATKKGWYIDLLTPPSPGTQKGERMISAPMLFGGRVLFQTVTPSQSVCDYGGSSWFMQVDPATGGELLASGFRGLGVTTIDLGDGVVANVSGLDAGVGLSGGFGVPITAGDKAYVPLTGTSGNLGATGISSGQIKPRASWRQIQ